MTKEYITFTFFDFETIDKSSKDSQQMTSNTFDEIEVRLKVFRNLIIPAKITSDF